jgi:hypothetical protein
MKNHSVRRLSKRALFTAVLAGLSLSILAGSTALAGINDDVGYTKLQTQLGGSTPTGAGVNVTQVEANETMNSAQYAPSVAGKTIILRDGPSAISSHASQVGAAFYGLSSIAPGVTGIESFNVAKATLPDVTTPTDWVDDFLHGISGSRPSWSLQNSRVANHSWVGTFGNNRADVDILYRTDWLVETDDFIQVVGINNGLNNAKPLLASAMNSISVGRTDANHSTGSVPLPVSDIGPPNGTYQTVYSASHPRPDIVVPDVSTSFAAPVVSSAATMLISASQAHPSWSNFSYTTGIDPIDSSSRATQTIRSAETSEVIKATLMAGADKFVLSNSFDGSSITTYRASLANQTANGLDNRYGAGQLNVYNSYRILSAGEQDSIQDTVGSPVDIGLAGFDYDNAFGTTQTQADYEFTASASGPLQATLAWNIEVDMNKVAAASTNAVFATAGTLYDLNLSLFDLTLGGGPIALSASTTDNTESIMATLISGHRYQLRVSTPSALAGSTEYGLAWAAIPEPSTVLCGVGLGLVALYRFSQRRTAKSKPAA